MPGSASLLRRGDILRIRDERWTVVRHVRHDAASVVEVLGSDASNRGVRARFLLPFEPAQRLPVARATRVVSPGRWRHLARQVLAHATPAYDALVAAARADIAILPFQLEPALAVVRGLASRILIADDVGLGKTVQAGLIVSEALERDGGAHVAVVVPAGLREQWAAELQRRFRLAPAIVDSSSLARLGPAGAPGANPWSAHPLIVTSADYVKRPEVLRALEALVWDVVVFDEAHGLCGKSDRRAAAAALAERARTVVMLTATPHGGDDEAFARLGSLGDLGRRFPLMVFRRTRRDAGLSSDRRTTWLKVRPTPEEMEVQRALADYARRVWRQARDSPAARLAMIVLTRRACSSASSLARSVERRLSLLADGTADRLQLPLPLGPAVDDEEPGAELGARGLDDAGEERRLLNDILVLAQRARDRQSKVRAVRRLLRRSTEPAIVFTEYRDTLAPLASGLAGFTTVQLHGGVGRTERREILGQFASGSARVLLATDAASEGLNLHQRCRLVINLELPWTPLRLEQRVGRVERIGQRRRVHEVHLVARDTPEESTVARLARRMVRVRQVLGSLRAPALDDLDVARCVLGGEAVPDGEPRDEPRPHGLIVPDLREAASAEARHLSTARALGAASSEPVSLVRPFAASSHRSPSRGCWAYRLTCADAQDEIVWETIVGVTFGLSGGQVCGASDVRRFLDRCRDRGAALVDREHDALIAGLAAALRAPVELAILREHAIMAAAEQRHARMAAALVQPALFDRRAERAASSQAEALAEMLGRCRTSLARLLRRQQRLTGAREAAFALLFR